MCCFLATLLLIGPRAGILVWWILDTARWTATFSQFIWPLLGFIFAPWTTIGYVIAMGDGVIQWFDWIIIGIAILLDLSSWFGGYRNRQQVPYYS